MPPICSPLLVMSTWVLSVSIPAASRPNFEATSMYLAMSLADQRAGFMTTPSFRVIRSASGNLSI